MADVKWIKIATEVFDNRKIKQIETMPDGDSVIVIWFKLLCLAGNVNDGGMVYFTNEMPYTDEMLATEFNRSLTTVRMALAIFQQYRMIEIIDNVYYISSWEKYQNVEGLEKIREQTRKRVAKHRELKAIEPLALQCNVTVTQSNATDIDIEIDKEKDIKDIVEKEPTALPIVKEIVDYLNLKAGTKYKNNSDKTRKSIEARMNEGFMIDDFKTVINKKTKEWLKTDMSKYLRPETLFGSKFESYLNQLDAAPQVKPSASKNKFNNFNQRTYDYDSLETQLLNRNIGG